MSMGIKGGLVSTTHGTNTGYDCFYSTPRATKKVRCKRATRSKTREANKRKRITREKNNERGKEKKERKVFVHVFRIVQDGRSERGVRSELARVGTSKCY